MTHLLQENGHFTAAIIITANIFIRRNFLLYGTSLAVIKKSQTGSDVGTF
jgi:hypothetical protein